MTKRTYRSASPERLYLGAMIVCGRYLDGFAGYSGETVYSGQFDSADTGTKYLPAFDIVTNA